MNAVQRDQRDAERFVNEPLGTGGKKDQSWWKLYLLLTYTQNSDFFPPMSVSNGRSVTKCRIYTYSELCVCKAFH